MRDRSSFRHSTLRDRRGFALIAVLVVMVVLGFIGAASLTLTAGDQKVTRLFTDANQADAAANAGLEHGIAKYQASAVFPFSATINGYTYTVSIKADSFDIDGNGTVGPVYRAADGTFNETANGNAVMVLTSTASKGSFKATQTMRVAKGSITLNAPAALTTNSGARLQGNITIDGRNHSINGTVQSNNGHTGGCNENKPGATVTDSTKVIDKGSNAVTLNGHSDFAGRTPPYTDKNATIVYVTPEDVLGLQPGDLDAYVQSAGTYVAPVDSLKGIVYVNGDYGSGAAGGNNLSGSGVLIVHNPLYNPREHDPSDPLYNASKSSNSLYAPANLGNINGGTYHGLIIADKIDKINGNIDIIGAVVSLSEIDVTIVGAGTANILYSCSALTQAANSVPVPPTRLSWSAD